MYHAYACIPTNRTYDIEPAKYAGSENEKKKWATFQLNVKLNLTKNATADTITIIASIKFTEFIKLQLYRGHAIIKRVIVRLIVSLL